MIESDDPITLAVGAGLIFGGVQAQQSSKSAKKAASKDRKRAAALALANQPGNVSRTAEPLEQVSEAGRRRRRRRQASFLTRGFDKPQLGIPGLLGVTAPLG